MLQQIDREYVVQWLRTLLSIPSPTGFCQQIINTLKDEAERLGYSVQLTPKGGAIITVSGNGEGPAIGLTAHVDTLGAMVRSIKDNGTLRLTPVGGYMMHSIEGEYCTIHTRDGRTYSGTILTTRPSVHVYTDARDLKREEANMEVRIDERVRTKADVERLGIRTGDYISFDPRTAVLDNGYIKSRHLDDKAGVAALFGLLEMMARHQLKPAKTIHMILSIYEEVGHGSAHIPTDIEEFIAVDMGAIGDDLAATEFDVSICAKDSTGPYDYGMTSRLIALAEQMKLPYAVDIYPQYGSDASAALRAGHGACWTGRPCIS